MGYYRKCKRCGKPFFAEGTVKYCSAECKEEAQRAYQRAYMAARRERETAERERAAKEAAARGETAPAPKPAAKTKPAKLEAPRFCGVCGKPLHGPKWRKYCSPKCSREAERRRERTAYDCGDRRSGKWKPAAEKRTEAEAVLRESERQRKAAAPAPTGVQTGLTMDQIAAEARKQHMSYGEYRQKLLIEQMRREKR